MLDLLVGFSILCQNYAPSSVIEERLPVARWTEIPFVKRDDDFIVTLSAEHFNGIDRVEFILDDGQPISVTEKTPHPETGYPEYLFPVGQLEDGYHIVDAFVYANSGEVLELTGDPLRFGNLNVRNN